MYSFDYQTPDDLSAAVEALKAEGAQAISGGQTLIPVLKQRLAMPSALVDLTGINSMSGIRRMGDHMLIGATATHASVAENAEVQNTLSGVAQLASMIGDPQVRNRGTIGGSLANNDPAACYPSAALACNAVITTDRREISADDFFQGLYTTCLEEGEIIVAIRFPIPMASTYQKFEQPASRFSLTSVFIARFSDGVRVAVTGAGSDGVFRHAGLEQALNANFSAAAVEGVAISSDGLMGDLHATPEYRANLIKVMAKRGVAALGG